MYSEVSRYGYGGQFWNENPSLPYRPVTTWEVWNEPNLHGIGAAEFGQFVSEVANAIQAASQAQGGRSTEVLSGGLLVWGNVGTGSIGYYGAMKYLDQAYAKFGSNGNVTGVAIHPYELDPATFLNGSSTPRIEAFKYAVAGYHTRLVELAKGGPQKSLWITETGWPVEGPQYAVGEAEQANLLRQVVDYLRNNEAILNVKSLLWYNFRDAPGTSSWDNFCGLRAHDGHLRQSWTAFQEKAGVPLVVPQAPVVQTHAASEMSSSKATLKGTVNPGNIPTTYRFEYGTTTSYGTSIPVPDGNAGEGGSAVALSGAATGLSPGTTYHYRLVASNALGTVAGLDSSFTTKRSTPAVVKGLNGELKVFYRATNEALNFWRWNAAKSTWSLQWLGEPNRLAGDPVPLESSNGELKVFYRATNGALEYWRWSPTEAKWSLHWLGEPNRLAGDPVPLESSNGELKVFYRATNGALEYWRWSPTEAKWSLHWLGEPNRLAGDPVPLESSNGELKVFYRATNGALEYWRWSPTEAKWSLNWLGEPNRLAGDPVPLESSNGELKVFYRATNGALEYWRWSPTEAKWSLHWLGEPNALDSEPTVVEESNGAMEIYYFTHQGPLNWWWWHSTGGWSLESLSGAENPGECPRRAGPYGYFAAPNAWSTLGSSYLLAFADVNGDCQADLVGRNPTTGERQVALSTGAGFAAPSSWGTWSPDGAVNFVLADVNGDGKADSVGRNSTTAEVRVGLSTGTTFNSSSLWTSWSLGYSMALGDVNGDGRDDIIGRSSTGNVQVGLSTGGGFAASTGWSSWSTAYSMDLADVNGDGRADLLGRNSSGNVQVGLSTGSSFATSTSWTSWSNTHSMALADVNGDGLVDLVGRNSSTGNIEVGLSAATFFRASTSWGSWSISTPPLFADVNGDGRADILGRDASNNVEVGRSTPG